MALEIISAGVAKFGALVTAKGRLETAAVSEDPLQDATDDGNAYALTSTYSATGGQEVMYLKNDSTDEHIHFHTLIIASQEASQWNLFEVTSVAAAGGTTGVVNNLNLTSGKAFSSRGTAFGEAEVTGTLTGNRLLLVRAAADTPLVIPLHGGIRLEQGDAAALTLVTGTTNTVEVTLVFFYA